jgi:hypothetical protein
MLIQHRVNKREKKMMKDEGHQYTSDNQTGFKHKRGTSELVFRLLTAHNKCLQRKQALWVAFYDVKKAFDSVPHVLIMRALIQRNLPPYLMQWMWYWIRNHTARLLAGDGKLNLDDESMDLKKARGTAQGSVTAPFLFNIYYNFIMEQVPDDPAHPVYSDPARYPPGAGRKQGDGCYADDSLQFRLQRPKLAKHCKQMERTATDNAVALHPEKSEVMVVGHNKKVTAKTKANHNVKLYGQQLPLTTEFEYVGVLINRCSLYQHQLDNRKAIRKVLKMAGGRGVRAWSAAFGMPTSLGSRIVQSMAYGSLFYGADVLAVNCSTTDTSLATLAKSVLNTYKCAGHAKLFLYLGWKRSKTTSALMNVSFALRMCRHEVTTLRTSFLKYISRPRDADTEFVKLLMTSIAELGADAVAGFDEWILELRARRADGFSDWTRWPWLTKRKSELKEEHRPHPIVQHSVHGHHSFAFMRDTQNFNPKSKHHTCWLCKSGGAQGDGPEHIVRDCTDARASSIMDSFCQAFELADRGLAVPILIGFMEYRDEQHVCHNFTPDQWRDVSRFHFRLYRLRKTERDKVMKPGYHVEIDNPANAAQLAADAAAPGAAADADQQADSDDDSEDDEGDEDDDQLDAAGN